MKRKKHTYRKPCIHILHIQTEQHMVALTIHRTEGGEQLSKPHSPLSFWEETTESETDSDSINNHQI